MDCECDEKLICLNMYMYIQRGKITSVQSSAVSIAVAINPICVYGIYAGDRAERKQICIIKKETEEIVGFSIHNTKVDDADIYDEMICIQKTRPQAIFVRTFVYIESSSLYSNE